MMKSPFKFLDSYSRDDREIFFGRDRETEELYHRVFESKIMLVYGVSGTGKSSLIHCGLANKFQDSDWLPVNIRRGSDILGSFASSLQQIALTPIEGEIKTPAQFKKAVKSLYLDHYKPIYFIFDQFEELFIFGSAEEKNGLVRVIRSIMDTNLQCRFIFVMREEYLATVSLFEKSIPEFFSNRIRIEKMSRENAVKAIEGPCSVAGIKTDTGFPHIVLDRLCPGDSEIELTYLQVYLDRIFRLASENTVKDGEIHFSSQNIEKAGNVTDVLGKFLDEQVDKQTDPELAIAVLKAFVSVKGTRQAMSQEDVVEFMVSIGRQLSSDALTSLLQEYVNLRILNEKDQHGNYELRHDALAAKIFEKFTLVEKELMEVRKFVENAYFNKETRGIYLGKDDLDYLDNYSGRLILPKDLDDFVMTSRNRLNAQKRAFLILTRISALLFLVILGGFARYYMNTRKSSENKDLINIAVMQSQLDPLQSLYTALSVWEKDSLSPLLHYVILNDVRMILEDTTGYPGLSESYQPFSCGSEIVSAEVSSTGKYIFGSLADGSVFTWETKSRLFKKFQHGKTLLDIKLNERDSSLALIFTDGSAKVTDIPGKEKFAFKVITNGITNERLVSFFPGGKYYLVSACCNDAMIYDSAGTVLFELKGHTGRINSVDVSSSGKFVATASCDKKVFIWNYNPQTACFSPYDTLEGHSDTVWSCMFNSTGLFVLTASADSTTKIWDLNGRILEPDMIFGARYMTGHSKGAFISEDEDKYNPDLKWYYSRACNASFSGRERAITMTGYEYNSQGKPVYHQVFFYDLNMGNFNDAVRDPMLQILNKEGASIKTTVFTQGDISPDRRMAAVVKKGSDKISLVSPQGLNIMELPGNFPMFTPDRSKFYWVKSDKILCLPLNPAGIRSILIKNAEKHGKGDLNRIWTTI